MTIKTLSLSVGHLWGRCVVAHGVAYLRRRVSRLDLAVHGAEHLAALAGSSFVMTSNHIWPSDTPLGRLATVRFLRQYEHSADSFIFHRAVREQTGRTLFTAARCDGGRWAQRPWKRRIQEQIGQPFARGQMGALPGYIAVEQNPGCFQRHFLESAREIIGRGEAILIFPGGITLDKPDLDPDFHAGASHLARRSHLPVLPACIIGSDSWLEGHPVTIAFGPAFPVDGLTKTEINAKILRLVKELHTTYAPGHLRRSQARSYSLSQSEQVHHVAKI